ncbi:MAG: CheR family methyltransferase [Pseudomonadota bacterium]
MAEQIATIGEEELERQDIELKLLLEAIYLMYGYDFRSYSKASVKRRVQHRLGMSGMGNIAQMIERVVHDREFFVQLLNDMTVNVTEMFRDPWFYKAFREEVIPQLRTYPFIKIWHAGCSTGEEIYSMAVLLTEEGLYERTQIYATDIDKVVLDKARKGIYPLASFKQYGENYLKAGGKRQLSDYYTAKYDSVIMDQRLKKNIVFADHDLATDQVFGEMQVVVCRNVIIYFDRELQRRVFSLFRDSLDIGGILCLGSKETMRFSGCDDEFEVLVKEARIYRKKTRI